MLEINYGDKDKAPNVGGLRNLYSSLANLDSFHFVADGAKQILQNPTYSFQAEYQRLKLVAKKVSEAAPREEFFTTNRTSFVISDDLQVFPNVMGLLQITTVLWHFRNG